MSFVSWREALAYCDWLTETLKASPHTPEPLKTLLCEQGWRVTLPSEAEWEKAARGGVGFSSNHSENRRLFPWGNELPSEDSNDYANMIYSKIRSTCVVGSFPKGVTPYGCMDMVGNVWEWTRNKFEDYPYVASDGREEINEETAPRVLRGGSWADYVVLVRCAYRLRYHPGGRFSHFGFRVAVRSAPVS